MLRRHLATVLLAGALATPAAADDESRYSEWRPEGDEAAQSSALDALAQELKALIEEAARASAADPRFLQDLRDRIAAHVADARPRTALVRDDFSDGDYTDDPRWTVVSGSFSVDRGRGLLTAVPLAKARGSGSDDPLDALLDTGGAILEGTGELLDSGANALDDLLSGEMKLDDLLGGGARDAKEDTGPAGPEPAEIALAAAIPNAFALELEMTSRSAGKGALLEIDLFQGGAGAAGYRLAYRPGSLAALVLSRFGRRGVVVIGEYRDKLQLEDGQSHTVALVRAGDGTMTASVDGSEVIQVKSSAFKDPFDGVSLVNGGGDYAIRSVAVYGER